jgi:hypothetical protein
LNRVSEPREVTFAKHGKSKVKLNKICPTEPKGVIKVQVRRPKLLLDSSAGSVVMTGIACAASGAGGCGGCCAQCLMEAGTGEAVGSERGGAGWPHDRRRCRLASRMRDHVFYAAEDTEERRGLIPAWKVSRHTHLDRTKRARRGDCSVHGVAVIMQQSRRGALSTHT